LREKILSWDTKKYFSRPGIHQTPELGQIHGVTKNPPGKKKSPVLGGIKTPLE